MSKITGSAPIMRNRNTALLLGVVLTLAGSRMIYDAYDARGRKKPWPLGLAL